MTSAVCLAGLGFAAGCGGDDAAEDDEVFESAYVVANEVYTGDSSTTYINVLSNLDITEVDYDKALEFNGGRAFIATVGGWLFVAGPESPNILRFTIAENGGLVPDGELSFSNFGFESVIMDEWGVTFISPTKAYYFSPDDGNTIVWNPTAMEIVGEIPPLESLVREGLTLNYTPAAVRGDRLFRTVYWNDWNAWTSSTEQYLLVYDIENDAMLELVEETRCPALGNRIATDEEGHLYFSNWVHNIAETLIDGAPSSCALRIDPGADRFSEDWVLSFPDVTGGREGAMFTYLGDGKGSLNVFHDEEVEYDENTNPSDLAASPNWRLWAMDFDAGTGAPVEGYDWMTGGASTFQMDDRAFVFLPTADYAATSIYEMIDNRVEQRFDVTGWSYQFLKVR